MLAPAVVILAGAEQAVVRHDEPGDESDAPAHMRVQFGSMPSLRRHHRATSPATRTTNHMDRPLLRGVLRLIRRIVDHPSVALGLLDRHVEQFDVITHRAA